MSDDHDPIIHRLLEGHRDFFERYQNSQYDGYRDTAAREQTPQSMIISCSDSRVSPSIITGSGLGEIFQVRNVANLVPPYEVEKDGHTTRHGTSAALEFAVLSLKVRHIIVLGHSGCGGIRALLEDTPTAHADGSFILPWMDIVRSAREKVCRLYPSQRQRACEEEALKISLTNLKSFPWIKSRVESGQLSLHAWHFDIPTGELCIYQPETDSFHCTGGTIRPPLA